MNLSGNQFGDVVLCQFPYSSGVASILEPEYAALETYCGCTFILPFAFILLPYQIAHFLKKVFPLALYLLNRLLT